MADRIHEILTIILYVVIFISPVLIYERVEYNTNLHYANDRIDDFLEEAADGMTATEYLTLSSMSDALGFILTVNVTTPDTFYSDAEVREIFDEQKEIELVPNTLIEVYLENNKSFLYGSRIYTVMSGDL